MIDLHPSGPVYEGEFLRIVTGSTLSGLNVDPNGDRDETGIFVEPRKYITGLRHIEQHTWRSQPDGVPSGAGDCDVTVYGLQKWMRLALKGNPNIHLVLFAPKEFRITDHLWAEELRTLAPFIVSKQAASQYLGYLTAQRQRLLGERGGRRIQRPLNDRGYDGKYATHMIRLGFQGIELMSTGRITLPMPIEERQYCIAIRRGELALDEVLTRCGELETELADLKTASPLRDTPDYETVDDFLHRVYMSTWEK